jgi:hypothetical protein
VSFRPAIILVGLTLVCLGPGVGAAPPAAPNVCSRLACAEVFPMTIPAGRGFIIPQYMVSERDGRSEIVADYGSAGRLRLVIVIVDLSDCDSRPPTDANGRLVRLEPAAYRGNAAQCRRVSLEVEPGAGIEEGTLRSRLFNVWLTAGHKVGANGDIAMPVERRIDLSKPE